MWKKTFPCNQCPKTFSEGGHLKTHLRMHSGENPFPCKKYPKAFSVPSSLKTHLRTHSGKKPFPCKKCLKFLYNWTNRSKECKSMS